MKKIVAAFTIIVISLVSCGTNYEPAVVSGFLIEQIAKWISSQKQYVLTNAKAGSDAEIGYKFESVNKEMGPKILDSYFKQETIINGNLATFKITAKKTIGDCKKGIWTIIHNAANPANPYRVVIEGENCEALIPNLCNYASSRKCGMEEVKDPVEEAKAELEAAAEKWIKEDKAAANTQTFTFTKEGEEARIWRATSKVKIGDCPAKSVWELWSDECETGNNPPKNKNCKSITPKVITNYKGGSGDGC
ncbi:MAG: hypothetical protein LBC75_03750 [Fibromonadaceae bacterium]|jgi:hypothetical protein|nr:hypothetical protein [Fibromonadaceae bacterium]